MVVAISIVLFDAFGSDVQCDDTDEKKDGDDDDDVTEFVGAETEMYSSDNGNGLGRMYTSTHGHVSALPAFHKRGPQRKVMRGVPR